MAAPPNTSIDASRGVVTSGNLTLAFHLAPDQAPDVATVHDQPSASRRALHAAGEGGRQPAGGGDGSGGGARFGNSRSGEELSGEKLGPHLFTVGITGEIAASTLALEPDEPARPGSWRLGLTMELLLSSLQSRARTDCCLLASIHARSLCSWVAPLLFILLLLSHKLHPHLFMVHAAHTCHRMRMFRNGIYLRQRPLLSACCEEGCGH